MTCHHCSGPLPAGSAPIRKYCGPVCKSAAGWVKRKAKITPEFHRAQYERSARYRSAARKRKQAGTCLECDRKPVARDRCFRHYRHLMKLEGRSWAADTDHASRTRRAGGQYQQINRVEIFERDRWVCQLCSEPVNPELKFPHRGSASLDHVTPLSRGGDHVPGNVQLAHLGCNSVKHDGGIQEYVEDVLALTEAGLSRAEIADAVGVSVRTVAWIRKRYRPVMAAA